LSVIKKRLLESLDAAQNRRTEEFAKTVIKVIPGISPGIPHRPHRTVIPGTSPAIQGTDRQVLFLKHLLQHSAQNN
jgi:hypothetical protein